MEAVDSYSILRSLIDVYFSKITTLSVKDPGEIVAAFTSGMPDNQRDELVTEIGSFAGTHDCGKDDLLAGEIEHVFHPETNFYRCKFRTAHESLLLKIAEIASKKS